MKFKKMIIFVLAFAILFSTFPISAYAASTVTYNSLDAIEEDWDIFKTIADGSISAVYENNTWYYQFTRSGYTTVKINVAAFMSNPKPKNNNLSADVSELNKSLSKLSTQNYSRICYYYTTKSDDNGNYTTYTSSMYRFKLIAGGTNDEFLVRCELEEKSKYPSCVTFTYSSKIRPLQQLEINLDQNAPTPAPTDQFSPFYITPSTKATYEAALQRNGGANDITPKMTIKIANTGNNSLNISRYTVSGKGNASSNIKDLIDIVYAAANLGKSIITGDYAGALKSIFDIDMGKLSKTSSGYNTGKEILLSENSKFVYEATFKSPIRLSQKGDWTQVVTKCNAAIGSAKFSVKIEFK